jgi:hypothetical protein
MLNRYLVCRTSRDRQRLPGRQLYVHIVALPLRVSSNLQCEPVHMKPPETSVGAGSSLTPRTSPNPPCKAARVGEDCMSSVIWS